MARPARVRIRSRNPCTRARRRLLGWKVRLPLATAISPYWVWPPRCRPLPISKAGVTRSAVVKLVRLALLVSAVPGRPGRSRIATCGRLFEGTDENSLGQTCDLATDRPGADRAPIPG